MKEYKTMAFELKALKDRQFEGYGSVFNNVDYGGDIVVPGAFKQTLKDHKSNGDLPQMYWMHKPDQVPGKWLEMEEDSKGLYVKGVLANTTLGNDMHELVSIKAVRGLSIGYVTEDRKYDKEGNRLLLKLDLWETSLVSLAMNPLARVESAKSRLSKDFEYVPEAAEFKRDLEMHLRDVGCSRTVAKALVAKIFDSDPSEMLTDPQRDADEPNEPSGLSDEEKSFAELCKKLNENFSATSLQNNLNLIRS